MFIKTTLDEAMQRLEALSEEDSRIFLEGVTMQAAELMVRIYPDEPVLAFFLAEKRRYTATGQLR